MARRDCQPDPAFDHGAEHESENEIPAAHASELAKREQGRGDGRGRMYHGRYVRVAEVEHIGTRGVEKRRRQRIETFAAPDYRRLPAAGESGERLQSGFDRRLAGAGERHGEEINERALGLMNGRRTEHFPSRIGDELRQVFGHFQIVRHRVPREGAEASTDADKSARMARRGDECEFCSSLGVSDAKGSHYRRGR